MAEQPKRKEPKLSRTDFESMTHEQLAALLDSASSESASHLATKLSKASSTITKIGDDLMTYVKGLEWQGEGGDAFRDWGGQTASATLRLGTYAEGASRWMGTVSQAIAEAKASMPDTSETTTAQADLSAAHKSLAAAQEPGARNDPDARKLAQTAQSDATAAQGRIDAARFEASQQMQKLAQTYQYSAQQVNSVPPPTFSPPADHMPPEQWVRPDNQYVSTGSQDSGGAATAASTASSTHGNSTGKHTVHTPAAKQAVLNLDAGRTDRSQHAAMEIDGATAPPQTHPSSPTTPPTTGVGINRPDHTSPMPTGLVPPAFDGSGGTGGPGGSTQGRVPGSMRPPMLPGQSSASGGLASRMPRENGIVGGRPVSPSAGRPSGAIPRGTVVGGEGSQGRTPMARGLGSGGLATGGTGNSGVAGGRRLASETDGVVGGRPQQPGRAPARPFTPGGSGLVRPSNTADSTHNSVTGRSGTTPHSASPSAASRDQRQGDRPDYLTEEEETWARNNRRALPPVVD